MPCRFSRSRCQPAASSSSCTLPPANTEAEKEMRDRFLARRDNFCEMRRQTRKIVLLMALIEALRHGPAQLVFAGKDGYPGRGEDDYGIAFWVGYFISWVYMCVFMVVFVPLFSWWIPSLPASDSTTGRAMTKAMEYLKAFDLFILPLAVVLSLLVHAYYTLHTLLHVDSPGSLFRVPSNNRKSHAARLLLIAGIGFALVMGYYAFAVLESTGLARVKDLEYMVIVVPVQVNIGMVLGTVMQWKMEKRILKKQARLEEVRKMEEGTNDEKTALMDAE